MEEIMRILVSSISLVVVLVGAQVAATAGPVDLRGKQGVVDPGYLKQWDPKPPRVERTAPPAPPVQRPQPNFDVTKSSDSARGYPPNGGDLPPPRAQSIPERHFVPPPRRGGTR
jgi:hypothetical protein